MRNGRGRFPSQCTRMGGGDPEAGAGLMCLQSTKGTEGLEGLEEQEPSRARWKERRRDTWPEASSGKTSQAS